MACAFHHSNEIGGEKKDAKAIDLCDQLTSDLDSAKTRYKYQAISIQVLVRLIMISITISTIVTVYCLGKDDTIIFNDESGKRDINVFDLERKSWCKGPLLFSMDFIGLVLPIIAAALQALEKGFRPDAKFANLLLTQHLIESEKFLFRARIRIYSSLDQTRGRSYENARKTFMKRCNTLYAECVQSEVKEGTLNPNCFSSTFASMVVKKIAAILKDIKAFFKCEPLNEFSEARAKHEFFVPSNWFVKCFKTKQGYQDWQRHHMHEVLQEFRNEEEELSRDVEEQRLRAVKEAVRTFGLDQIDEYTLDSIYAIEQNEIKLNKYCIISLDQYVTLRLIPMREKFRKSLPVFIFWRNVLQGKPDIE
jgi:hypothetical protein